MRLVTDRRNKMIEKMRHNPRGWRFAQVKRLLEYFGFKARQPSGGSSHYVFVHPDIEPILSIKRSDPLKPIYVKEAIKFLDILFEKWRGE